IAAGHIPKASYNVFKLLHQLGNKRIALDSESAIATIREDGSLAVALWNYAAPNEAGAPRSFTLSTSGLGGKRHARIQVVDRQHVSALKEWEAMGKPDFPSHDQTERLRKAAQLAVPETRTLTSSRASFSITLQPHALALVQIEK